MKLYRNINWIELLKLLKEGRIEGRYHQEDEDTDYFKEKHGKIVFFFEEPIDLSSRFRYSFLLEVEVPEERIKGKGLARYHEVPPCSCCPIQTQEFDEFYVSHYELNDVTRITPTSFNMGVMFDTKHWNYFEGVICMSLNADDYTEEEFDYLIDLFSSSDYRKWMMDVKSIRKTLNLFKKVFKHVQIEDVLKKFENEIRRFSYISEDEIKKEIKQIKETINFIVSLEDDKKINRLFFDLFKKETVEMTALI